MEIELINGDSLLELPKLKDESVDLIACDPPYGISIPGSKIVRKGTTDIQMDFGEWDYFETEEDFYEFSAKWFYECMRILKKEGWMYVFCGNSLIWVFQHLIRVYREFDIKQRSLFSWCKTNPAPSYRKYNWISSTEPALIFSKGKCRIPNFLDQTRMKNYMNTSCRSNYGVSGHPTEKPIQLMNLFVESSSNVGDMVLDPFMGSGTTGMSCLQYGRNFVGMENNKKWFDYAEDRLNNFKMYVEATEGDGLLI